MRAEEGPHSFARLSNHSDQKNICTAFAGVPLLYIISLPLWYRASGQKRPPPHTIIHIMYNVTPSYTYRNRDVFSARKRNAIGARKCASRAGSIVFLLHCRHQGRSKKMLPPLCRHYCKTNNAKSSEAITEDIF